MGRRFVLFVTLFVLALTGVGADALAQTFQSRVDESIVLENEYIAIIVNAREEDTGRFSVNTTGGDPERTGDEDKPLVFGTERSPGPWTSYTTVRVDERDHVIGGPTGKRAGRTGPFTEPIRLPYVHEDKEIRTSWQAGDVVITQKLSIAPGVTTGRLDTARIEYEVTNEGEQRRSVGLRVVLDTLLGRNDGAPFQVAGEAVTTDTAFQGERIPDYFQAFDSLADPRVVSQGTLRAFDTTVPDEVYFSNWGSLADGIWRFNFEPGRDFSRAGEEFELDSAVALYWHEQSLDPGETRTYVTYYGLGGITIAPGHLSLGITSPARIDGSHQDDGTFEVRAYIENTGDWIARDTVVRLENPNPLHIVDGPASIELGDMAPRESRQVAWRVAVPAGSSGEFTYRVAVRSSNADPNRVDRGITVTAPASLTATWVGPDALTVEDGRWSPVPFVTAARVTNTGQLDAHDVTASITPFGLAHAQGEKNEKHIGTIAAGETVHVPWHLVPEGTIGNLPVSLQLHSTDAKIDARLPTHFVVVPQLESALRLRVGDEGLARATYETGDTFVVRLDAVNVPQLYGAALELEFDPAVVQVLGGSLGVDRGRLFVQTDPVTGTSEVLDWVRPAHVDNERGVVRVAGRRAPEGPLRRANDSVATIRFRAVGEGNTSLHVRAAEDHPYLHEEAQPAVFVDEGGHAVDAVIGDAYVVVVEEEEE